MTDRTARIARNGAKRARGGGHLLQAANKKGRRTALFLISSGTRHGDINIPATDNNYFTVMKLGHAPSSGVKDSTTPFMQ